MSNKSARFSHRHLLALGTFLVPLMVLAALGWNELQRSGEMAVTSSEREARQFLARAQDAITRQVNTQVTQALAESERLVIESPIRAAIQLRDLTPAVLDVLLINDEAGLVWPGLPVYTVSLPLVNEPTTAIEDRRIPALSKAELQIEYHQFEPAADKLADLIEELRTANPPTDRRRPDLARAEAHACFRLGTVLRELGNAPAARARFQEVESMTRNWSWRTGIELHFLAKGVLAEMGSSEERLAMLRAIAEDSYPSVTDGLAGAIAQRLAETFEPDDPRHPEIERYLLEDEQRAASREFASDYSQVFSYQVRPRIRPRDPSAPPLVQERLVSTDTAYPMLLAIRPATPDEQKQEQQCAYVALHFDLAELIEPAVATLASDDRYALSIAGRNGIALWAPEKAPPTNFVAPTVETSGLTLKVYPADPERLLAEANAAATKRTLLVLALLITAIGGALWSWRSVSREAELAALKINLVSRVSHELKTPLALIRMYGETIGMGRVRDPEQSSEFGSIIARESERLTTLIQRILDFSRQQAGTLTYQSEPYDIGELLRTTAYAYAPHLEEKGVILIDSLPLGIVVSCDKDGLEGAIINLLENATKYSVDGESEHEVDLLLQGTREHAVIEVQDRGRGIPHGEHKRIFEGFYRASNSGEVRGAGLGLGIVQHFARAHDGEIEALPREGGGTIMRLTLPLAKRNTSPPSASHAPNKTPGTPT